MTGPSTDTRTPCAIESAEMMAAAQAIFIHLAKGRFNLAQEKTAQAEAEDHLVEVLGRGPVSREHRLGPGDIPDFLIAPGVVIEMKGPRHQASAVLRQLERYAAYPEVGFIILATARAMTMPATIGGKPCRVLNLGRAWL